MKLPRWLVIAMLTTSVLSVLAAAGWWWVTWPERTASEFFKLVTDLKFDEAKRLCSVQALEIIDAWDSGLKQLKMEIDVARTDPIEGTDLLKEIEADIEILRKEFTPAFAKHRTALDVLFGSMEFKVADGDLCVTVCRGKVTEINAIYVLKE